MIAFIRRNRPATANPIPRACHSALGLGASVERLECRIAPASTVSFVTSNGIKTLQVRDYVSGGGNDNLTISYDGAYYYVVDASQTLILSAATGLSWIDSSNHALGIQADASLVTHLSVLTQAGNDSVTFSGDLTVAGTLTVNLGTGTDSLASLPSITAATLSLTPNSAVSQSGPLIISGTSSVSAGAFAVNLSDTGNSFGGTVTLSNSGANNVSLASSGALVLGNVSVGSGTLTVSGEGISQATSTTIVQAAGAGLASFDGGTGAIALTKSGNVFTGAVALSNTGTENVALTRSGGALVLGNVAVGSGTLTVTAVGISQAASTSIVQDADAGAATFSAGAGAITLGNSGNSLTGPVTLSNSGANNVALVDSGALVLGSVSVGSGTLSLTGVGISQAASTTIVQAAGAGTATFSGGGGEIALTNSNNVFTGAVALSNSGANDVSLTRSGGALVLGNVAVGSGSLTVTAVGISQGASKTIVQEAGAVAANFSAGSGAISLGNSGNLFTGPVALSNSGASNVALVDSGALVLGDVSVGSGTLSVTGVGISQADSTAIVQAAGAGAVSFSAGAGEIALTNSGNVLTGSVALSNSGANNAALTRSGGSLVLGNLNVGSGTLSLVGVGISQAASTTIVQAAGAGLASFDGGAGAIALANSNNVFTGMVALSNSGANNVALTRSGGSLVLGDVSVGSGTLSVAAIGISQAASTSIVQDADAGTASFSAGAGAIALTNGSNVFTGAVALSNSGANHVTLADSGALVLGNVSVGSGTLTVSGLGISQASLTSIVQEANAGASSFSAGAGAIALDSADNSFTGTVALSNSGANNVTLASSGALVLGNVGVGSGTLTLAGVGISQAASTTIVQAAGAGLACFDGGAGAIALANSNNVFTGAVALSNSGANDVALTRSGGALVLGNVTVGSGALSVTATAISQAASTSLAQEADAGAVSFHATSGSIDLSKSNDFTGSVTAWAEGMGNTVVIEDGSGDFLVGGAISNNAAITLNASSGDLTLTGAVSSGGTLGGAISVTAAGRVAVESGASLSSASGSGGVLSLSESVTFAGTLALGSGNITLQGGAGSMTIAGPISVGHSLSLLASGDINILAKVETTGSTSNLTVTADSDLDADGGLYVGSGSAAGWLKAGKNLEVSGSEYAGSYLPNYAASLASVIISGNGTSARLEAAGSVTISPSAAAPEGARLWLGGLVRSSGTGILTVSGPILLTGSDAWLQTGGGGVTFEGAVDGANDLRVTAGTGPVRFEGAVGGVTAAGSVLVDSASQFTTLGSFDASGLTLTSVTSSISLGGAVTLGAGGLSASATSLTVEPTVSVSGGGSIFLQADSISLVSALSGTGTLTLQPKTLSRSIGINGAGDFNLSAEELALLSDGFSGIQIGRANGTGAVTVGGASFSDPVQILSPGTGGTITLNGAVTGLGGASVQLQGRSIYLNVEGPDPVASSEESDVTLNGNVILQKDTVLSAGGAITQTGFINGAFSLAATAGGAITFNGGTTSAPGGASIGGSAPLTSISLTGGSLSLQPQTVTSGSQTYTSEGVILLRGGAFRSTTAGSITFNGPVEVRAEVGVSTAGHAEDNISFTSTVDSENGRAGGLRLSAGLADVTIGGAVGATRPLGTLKVLGALGVSMGGVSVTSGVSITASGAVSLGETLTASGAGAPVTITADSLTCSGGLSAAGAMTLTANEMNFTNGPGSVAGSGALVLRPLGVAVPVYLGGANGDVEGQLDLDQTDLAALADGFSSIYIGRGDATGSMTLDEGGVQFKDPTTLCVASKLADIHVLGALSGTGNASLSLIARATHLYGAVSTSGQAISLRYAILHGDVAASSGGGALTFAGRVSCQDGAWNLSANAGGGVLSFTGGVGTSPAPLGTFSATSSNLTNLTGGFYAQSASLGGGATLRLGAAFVLTDAFSASDPVILTGNSVVKTTEGSITFGGSINALSGKAPSLALVNLAGAVSVGGAIGAEAPLGGLTVSSPAAVTLGSVTASSLTVKGAGISAGSVLTAGGSQSYTGAITALGGDLTGKNLTISTSSSIANAPSCVWSFSGMTTLKTLSTASISVTGAGHQLGSLVLIGANATIDNSTATLLRSVALAGNLDLESAGSVTQSGKVSVRGLAIQSGGSILLSTVINCFWSLDGISAQGEVSLISGGHNVAINAAITTTAGNVTIAADAGTSRNHIINHFGAGAISISGGDSYGYVLYSYSQSGTTLGGLSPASSSAGVRFPTNADGALNAVFYAR